MSGDVANFSRAPDILIGLLRERDAEIDRLTSLLKRAQAMLWGARSEKSSAILEGQEALDLGDLADDVTLVPANDADTNTLTVSGTKRKKAVRNIGALPKHLVRIEEIIEPASTQCACCKGALHRIGQDVAEALDSMPAVLRVLRTIRPKYACRQCQAAPVQAPAKRRMFEGGMATTSLIANVVVWKFVWYVPLHRQVQMLSGQGIALDRNTLGLWVKRSAWWLMGLYRRQLEIIHGYDRIFCDETRMPVQDKSKQRVRTGWFWAHAVDDRPWNGLAPPAVVYIYAQSRGNAAIKQQLAGYHGTLQVDGYGAYKSLIKASSRSDMGNRNIDLAFCMAHARRKFTDIYKKTASPIARSIIEQIGRIYAIEAQIGGTIAEYRLQIRQTETAPLMAQLKVMLNEALPQLSIKSALAGAIQYALTHWDGLNLFLHDGRLEIDSNTVERTMRGIALGRRNSLFSGSDGGAESWAVLSSLLQTACLNGLDPYEWLNDVLEKIVSGAVKSHELDQLLAWNWRAAADPAMRLAA
ncbi:IS66 family transposase [Sphingobium sp. BS19]|uniref:IS66 family transposase n=1 Tax=Sphingobium sp. BS19 TaxID=3018973 RepID=UPI0024902E8B|nr:IS66 family transposase [Sphingobium sp. BS19]